MIKKLILAATLMTTLAGCADNKNLPVAQNGSMVEVKTYGFIDKDSVKEECVNYSISYGNIVWSVILSETLAFPIYFVGFSLYEPDSVDYTCLKARYDT